VFHSGPGIRGGGASDVSSKLRRHAHFDELPSFTPIAAALRRARDYVPPGLANWTRHAPNAQTAPVSGFGRLYSASHGSDFIALAVGLEQPVVVRVRDGGTIDVRQTGTGKVINHVTVSSGGSVTLSGDEPIVLVRCCTSQ
jgi:hypothetical protein